MKLNIGDKFYTFEKGYDSFEVHEYKVHQIMLHADEVRRYRASNSGWFDEDQCLTKEEVLMNINEEISKIEKGKYL